MSARARLWFAGILGFQTGLTLLLFRAHGGALIDDAYISFRYATRLAAGQGLTWNPGVAVEGFSNPVWTLALALVARLGAPPHATAFPLGLLLALVATAAVMAAARRLGLGPARSTLAGGLVAGDVGLATWAGSGLETGLTTALVALWLREAGALRDPRRGLAQGLRLGILGAVLALSRPEGVVWTGLGCAWLIWGVWAPRRLLVGWFLGAIPLLAAYQGFRLVYYGSLLPNTFFAKVEPGEAGLRNAVATLGGWAAAHVVLLAVAALGAVLRRGRPAESSGIPPRFPWLLWGWLLAQAGFVLVAGGDWMGDSRYMAPTVPVLALAVVVSVRGLSIRPRLGWLAAILVTAQFIWGWRAGDRIPTYTTAGREVGVWLARVADPGDRLAVTAAGAIPYFSGLWTYDVLGLNDPEVRGRRPQQSPGWAPGHNRYDLDRLLELAPEWIVWDFGVDANRARMRALRGTGQKTAGLGFRRELLARDGFQARYRVETAAPWESQNHYTVFRRR